MNKVSILLAFSGGLLSFFSPCILPLIPSYLIYISGASLADLAQADARKRMVKHALFFVLGFSLIFILLGATASLIGQWLFQYRQFLRLIGASVLLLFGFYLAGVFKWKMMDFEHRFNLKVKPAGYWGSFLVGVAFSAGWTPCVGPILAGILVLAGAKATLFSGILLLVFYALGLAVPFLLFAYFLDAVIKHLKKFQKVVPMVTVASGILLILIGIGLLAGMF